MLKKPLFWIIVVIVIVILWFVFSGGRKEGADHSASAPAVVTQPAATGTGSSNSGGAQ